MKLFFLILTIFFTNFVQALDLPKEQAETKIAMNQIYDSFVKIIPYVYSDKLIFDQIPKNNSDELIKNLEDIKKVFKDAKHLKMLKAPGFKPSLDTMSIHIQETIDSLQARNKIFAHARLKAMTALCITCHTQLSHTVSKNAFGPNHGILPRTSFDSDFAYANYLYLMRSFPEAIKYYELTIEKSLEVNGQNSSGTTDEELALKTDLSNSFKRVLSVYTKINFEPLKAINFIKKYSNNKNVGKANKTEIEIWLKSLDQWQKFNNKKVIVSDFINTYLKNLESAKEHINTGLDDITLLVASGVLSKSLYENPKSDVTPEILYWLSIAERRLSTTYFFSLSDIYLKECVTQYPKTSYAKKCYQEYEDNIIFGYSGSSGTDIPPDEKRELDRLKLLLK